MAESATHENPFKTPVPAAKVTPLENVMEREPINPQAQLDAGESTFTNPLSAVDSSQMIWFVSAVKTEPATAPAGASAPTGGVTPSVTIAVLWIKLSLALAPKLVRSTSHQAQEVRRRWDSSSLVTDAATSCCPGDMSPRLNARAAGTQDAIFTGF